jgi:hypothetical protein
MVTAYCLLFIVMTVVLIGRLVSDKIQDRQQWFCFYEQRKITTPTPRRIKRWHELPVDYQAFFPQQENVPYTVYIPGSAAVLSPRKELLLVLHAEHLTLYAGQSTSGQELAFDQILYLEHAKMLFSFWLKIICEHQTYTIEYYTTGDDTFAPIIERIRLWLSSQAGQSVCPDDDVLESTPPNWLSNIPHIFMNKAKSRLLAGQPIVKALFQPSFLLKKKTPVPFLSTTRIYSPHLSVLTAHELILIQKRTPIQTVTSDQYAVKSLFIPYQRIRTAVLTKQVPDIFQIQLFLTDRISLPIFFATENTQTPAFFNKLQQVVTR